MARRLHVALLACTIAPLAGCEFGMKCRMDSEAGGLAGAAAGGGIGTMLFGPAGGKIGSDVGYIVGTAAAAYGLKKRRDAIRATSVPNGTTISPATSARVAAGH